MSSSEEVEGHSGVPEWFIDLAQAGWTRGEPCIGCSHGNVHTIVRAGVLFRDTGDCVVEEILECTMHTVRTATGSHPCVESYGRTVSEEVVRGPIEVLVSWHSSRTNHRWDTENDNPAVERLYLEKNSRYALVA